MKNIKLFKMINGEVILTEMEGITDENMYILIYPSMIVHMNENGQIGFGKYLPFSDYKKDIFLNPKAIAVESEPAPDLINTYEQWVTQMKARESGIILPGSAPKTNVMNNGISKDFTRLNTSR